MNPVPVVRVNHKAANRVRSGHLWLFASDILDSGSAAPGDAVTVLDPQSRVLGTAHFSSTSQIRLRLLSDRVEAIDEAWLRTRIERAHAYRRSVVGNSAAYRLVHAEGDLLPGLIVDRYGDFLAVQILDQGMDRLTPTIISVLSSLLVPKGILARDDAPARAKEGLAREVRVLAGEIPDDVAVEMNGLSWHVDLKGGQKTGIFLDQRENYLAAREYARGRALDCFTGTGGFALHVAQRCDSVDAVDSSGPSTTTARKNAAANGITNVAFHEANVFDYLPGVISAGRKFNTIVIDPPAFAKSRSAVEPAARGYKEVNLRALRLLEAGGILVTCSCSHHMSEAQLLELIASAALDCGKRLRVIERRTQARDHPILLTVPETHYLKCLVFEAL